MHVRIYIYIIYSLIGMCYIHVHQTDKPKNALRLPLKDWGQRFFWGEGSKAKRLVKHNQTCSRKRSDPRIECIHNLNLNHWVKALLHKELGLWTKLGIHKYNPMKIPTTVTFYARNNKMVQPWVTRARVNITSYPVEYLGTTNTYQVHNAWAIPRPANQVPDF